MTAPKKPRNRAAQDATLINMRALGKRVQQLERDVRRLEAFCAATARASSPRAMADAFVRMTRG